MVRGRTGQARARAGQGKPLTVRFAHSPGFSGMVYPTWCGREKLKVFGQAFFKKLAGCGTESHDLAFLRKRRRKGEKSPSGTFLGGGLRCRVGRSLDACHRHAATPRRGALVAGGDRSAPTEPAGETSQANRRFAVKFTNLPLSHRPKRAPSFGASDGGGTRERGAYPLVSAADQRPHRGSQVCPPGGESFRGEPFGDSPLSWGGE